jgi:hypothetical protein
MTLIKRKVLLKKTGKRTTDFLNLSQQAVIFATLKTRKNAKTDKTNFEAKVNVPAARCSICYSYCIIMHVLRQGR